MPATPRLPLRSASATLLFATLLAILGCGRADRSVVQTLPDGTRLYFRAGTTVTPAAGYPHPRRIQIDGEVLIKAPSFNAPLLLSSRLMEVAVTGEAVLRETAFAQQTGEQVDLVIGQAVVRKAYKSSYMIPDSLAPGEMAMVNQTIDLMEKEKSEAQPLGDWISAMERAARPE